MVRIFALCHSTQLLVVQHLRANLKLPQAREFLVWHAIGNSREQGEFMQNIVDAAEFSDSLNIQNFESLRPRTHGHATWWIESLRRLRHDAALVHRWMQKNGIEETEIELWVDDPIHFVTVFMLALLPKARRVKFPHGFHLEDLNAPALKATTLKKWRHPRWAKRAIYWRLIRWVVGVDYRLDKCVFDRAYTFDRPSCWASDSRDVSGLVSTDAFSKTYGLLPKSLREDAEKSVRTIRQGPRPLILLLLFGLHSHPEMRNAYQMAVSRILKQRGAELKGYSFAVKAHPAGVGREEALLFDWLRENISGPLFIISTQLNLEFMLDQIRPDFVWAGPCGALPVVKRLQIGRAIVLPEIMDLWRPDPEEWERTLKVVPGIEEW